MLKDFKPIDFKSNSIFKALFTTIILYILQLLIVGSFIFVTNNNLLSYAITNVFMIVVIVLLERKRIFNAFKTFKEDSKGKLKNIILFTITLLIAEFIFNYIVIKLIGNIPEDTTNLMNELREKNVISWISYISNTLILLPFVESLIYFYPYEKIKNRIPAFIFYTIIFALFHMTTVTSLGQMLYLVSYILLSFAITYSYYKTNNILYPTIMHALNNVLAVINILILFR